MENKLSAKKFVVTTFCTFITMGIVNGVVMVIYLKRGKIAEAIMYSVPTVVMFLAGFNIMSTYRLLVLSGMIPPGGNDTLNPDVQTSKEERKDCEHVRMK